MERNHGSDRRPLPSDFESIADEVTRLAETVDALAARLDSRDAELLACVTTRRVEVLDPDNVVRVVLSATDQRSSIEVRTSSPSPNSTVIELFATDADHDDACAGLELVDNGNVVASLSRQGDGWARFWLATAEDHLE